MGHHGGGLTTSKSAPCCREKIDALEHSIDQERSAVIKLTDKVMASEVATKATKDKVERMEAKAAAHQVKVILRMVKASLMAYEVGFRKCKTLVGQLFSEVDTDLLDVSPPSELKAPVAKDAPDPTIKGSSQARDGPSSEAES